MSKTTTQLERIHGDGYAGATWIKLEYSDGTRKKLTSGEDDEELSKLVKAVNAYDELKAKAGMFDELAKGFATTVGWYDGQYETFKKLTDLSKRAKELTDIGR